VDRLEKKEFVASLQGALADAGLVVVTTQTGLTVGQSSDLRRKMRGEGAHFKVAKNTLVRIAVQGTPCEELSVHMKGPTGLAYSQDPVVAARVAVEFAKTSGDKFDVVCGMMQGKFLDKNAVKALASLPSLDVLRGKLVGLLQAPATKLAGVTQAPAGQLARVFSAYGNKA